MPLSEYSTEIEQMTVLNSWLEPCMHRGCEWRTELDMGNGEWRIVHDQAPQGTFITRVADLLLYESIVRNQVDEWLLSRHAPVRAEV